MNNIKKIRKISGLKRSDFCKKYNIPVRTVEDWEYEKNTPPSYIEQLLERVVKEDLEKGENIMLSEFKKYHLKKHVYEELEKYIADAEKYKKNLIDSVELKNSYELVYTSLKHQWRLGRITEQDFNYLTDILKREVE